VGGARDPGRRRRPALIAGGVRRLRAGAHRLRPPRTLRPTRAGWLFFGLVFSVGFAALNTGNNLLYLVLSLMLAFLVLSGALSEAALRGIDVRRHLPFEWVAGAPARVVLEIANGQRRVWSHAIVVEDRGDEGGSGCIGRVFALHVAPGAHERRSYSCVPARRGGLQFRGFRVTTRFPFGLFAKSLWIERPATALVYPPLQPVPPPPARETVRPVGRERRGRSAAPDEVTGLREFTRGDAARRVHWPASWRRGLLLVRDAEGETAGETEVALRTRGVLPGPTFEEAVARAASEAEASLRAGLRVGLRTDTGSLSPEAGPLHRARLLGYLALVRAEPDDPDGEPMPTASAREAG
jgi:uncharacterized protein (DUF58 family)